jgi:branched-subunit amino acid aminotransferase/4-amino-4-deoxychorismate lyase
MKCFFNLLETKDVKLIELFTIKWLHLQGCFETILVKNGKAQFLEHHIARAKKTNLEIFKLFYDYDLLILSLLKEISNYCSINMLYKLKIIFSEENIFYSIETYSPKYPAELLLTSKDSSADFKFIPTNHKLCDYKKYLNLLSTIDSKFWDCVRTNGREYLETTKANIYFCNSKGIFTPSQGDLLPGIIRQIAIEEKLVLESNIFVGSLVDFDGMLISNSLIGIAAVDTLDGHRFSRSQNYKTHLESLIFS